MGSNGAALCINMYMSFMSFMTSFAPPLVNDDLQSARALFAAPRNNRDDPQEVRNFPEFYIFIFYIFLYN